LADLAIVSLADQPISLANACEEPVVRDPRTGGYLKPSVAKLTGYWSRINQAYGLNEQARAFALMDGIKLGDQDAWTELARLENWLARDVEA
jgi:CRISPR system Cascade subunit CasC